MSANETLTPPVVGQTVYVNYGKDGNHGRATIASRPVTVTDVRSAEPWTAIDCRESGAAVFRCQPVDAADRTTPFAYVPLSTGTPSVGDRVGVRLAALPGGQLTPATVIALNADDTLDAQVEQSGEHREVGFGGGDPSSLRPEWSWEPAGTVAD